MAMKGTIPAKKRTGKARKKPLKPKGAAGKKVAAALRPRPTTDAQAKRAVETIASPAQEPVHPRRPDADEAQVLTRLAKQHVRAAGASAFVIPALDDGVVLAYGTPAQLRQLLKPQGRISRFRSAVTGLFVRPGFAKRHPKTTTRETR